MSYQFHLFRQNCFQSYLNVSYIMLFYLLFYNFSQLRELLSSEGVTDENKELLDVSKKS